MPTDWVPWPGKTKAIVFIVLQGRRRAAEDRESACTVAGIGPPGLRSGGEDPRVTDSPDPERASRPVPVPPRCGGALRRVRPGRRARAARGARPDARARAPQPRDRPRVRGGPLRAGAGRRDADPERAPDLRAGGDGPGAVARAGRRVSRPSSASCASGFTQLAALYVLADGATTTIADLAESIGRSPSATSRLVDGLVKRRLVERRREEDDRRQRSVWLTPRGHAMLRMVDRARAEQFLSAVRPMPRGERALVAMGVAALATHAISRRGRLVRGGRLSAGARVRRRTGSAAVAATTS